LGIINTGYLCLIQIRFVAILKSCFAVQAEEKTKRGRLRFFCYTRRGQVLPHVTKGAGGMRAEDVVVELFSPYTPGSVQPLFRCMEIIPLKGRCSAEVMDLDLILGRRPQVCLVDGLACR
jgi:hypothetical protein